MTATGYPQEGETIGHFRVGRRIGGGGMGVVYEAQDESLERRVALKVIAPSLAEDQAFRVRFTREAQAQASLDSPHVVHVYAHGEDGGRLYLASQLIPDGDLKAMLTRHGAPPVVTALDIMQQVASGLAAAHEAGLIHRDIKPANVLLRRRGTGFQAYLADFGIARQLDAEVTRTASSATVGTPSYMAPELHTGGTPGTASDIYSLGCLLWACLSGRAPYAGTSDYEVVTAHREQPVPQLGDESAGAGAINDLLRRLMAKDPAERPASAAGVRDELARLRAVAAAAPAPTDTPIPPVAPAAPPPRSRSWLLGIGLVVLVLLVAGIAVVGYGSIRGDDDTAGEVTPSPSASETPSSTPRSTPSETPTPSGASTYEVQPGDEDRAAASMGSALTGALGVSEEQGTCIAASAITTIGLQGLVDIGMFDEDLTYVDIDLATHPEVKSALDSAVLGCF